MDKNNWMDVTQSALCFSSEAPENPKRFESSNFSHVGLFLTVGLRESEWKEGGEDTSWLRQGGFLK